ncbi:MAG: sulfotransferase [Shewanella vesiculosa]|uniref:sulfotransferase family protein n=1 Tax=Shewanella vesiculosa TaxID=518738 RepID=UPI0023524ADB|nr:sulfotransferase [Shewanella vesiculosa]NCP38802.1 sulfotransferase [Shewanella vesiculosa]NCQ47221.1 sulfotransferase [Shewanella frigidimarina]
MGKISFTLPDFVIIGANKAGTTSLANYLTQHPEIRISTVKEPMFFSSEPSRISAGLKDATLAAPYFSLTLREYSDQFEPHTDEIKWFGEASTSYLANPRFSSILLKKIVPDVKIVAMLREPTARAISAYKMCYGNGIEKRTFEETLVTLDMQSKINDHHGVREYVRNSLYGQLLMPYINTFEHANLLFLKYDDFLKNPHGELEKILQFIGVTSYTFDTDTWHNTESDHVTTPIEILESSKDKLHKFFQSDIQITQSITNLDLSNWLD